MVGGCRWAPHIGDSPWFVGLGTEEAVVDNGLASVRGEWGRLDWGAVASEVVGLDSSSLGRQKVQTERPDNHLEGVVPCGDEVADIEEDTPSLRSLSCRMKVIKGVRDYGERTVACLIAYSRHWL